MGRAIIVLALLLTGLIIWSAFWWWALGVIIEWWEFRNIDEPRKIKIPKL